MADWAHLPSVVVHLISEKIKSTSDYVRFRAVCCPWRSASHPKPRHLPPQLPWLMIPYSPRQIGDADDGVRLFYDHWQSKTHKIHLPETIGKACCASYRGWILLVASGGAELFLLNPLTRARVQLPPFTNPVEHIWDGDPDDYARWGERSPLIVDHLFKSMAGTCAITKVTFSADLTHPNCLIMVFFQRAQGIFFCKVRDCCWTEVVRPLFPSAELADAAYSNGTFYLLEDEAFFIYDLNRHKGIGEAFKQKNEMYQVLEQERRMEVKRIADTSDTTIFYGDNNYYLAVRTDDWDTLDGGSMYMEYLCSSWAVNEVMVNHIDPTHWREHKPCYSIFYDKLDDGTPELVAVGIGDMPQIWSPPPAMWFQPNFF